MTAHVGPAIICAYMYAVCMHTSVHFSVGNGAQSQILVALLRWIRYEHDNEHCASVEQYVEKTRQHETRGINGLEIRTKESREQGAGTGVVTDFRLYKVLQLRGVVVV